jgi:hypothetical protein
MRAKLTLKNRPDPSSAPKVDPAKVALSEQLGIRYVMRDYRYICQKLVVSYEAHIPNSLAIHELTNRVLNPPELSRTWIDVPLVPEAYGT